MMRPVMDLFAIGEPNLSTHGTIAALSVFGILALYLAFKVVKFVFKVVLGLIAVALIGGAVLWLLQGH
jgi:hypothetical protein